MKASSMVNETPDPQFHGPFERTLVNKTIAQSII